MLPSIIVVSYHFYPSSEVGARRVSSLARYLAETGSKVYVISAFGGQAADLSSLHPRLIPIVVADSPTPLLNLVVRLKRSLKQTFSRILRPTEGGTTDSVDRRPVSPPGPPRKRPVRDLFFRFVLFLDEHKRWSWRASRVALQLAREAPAAIISSGPPMSQLLAAAIAARRLRIPFIVDLRDPWTDYDHNRVSALDRLETRLSAALEARTLTYANLIVCTTRGLQRALTERLPGLGSKTSVITNGCDHEPRSLSDATGHRLNILFAGEIYANRDPFPFLNALERLLERPEVDIRHMSVKFIGRCGSYRGRSLAEWLEGRRCQQIVEILPSVPPEQVGRLVEECSVVLNLAQNQLLQIPAKTFEHLASGRENLVLCEADSDTAHLIDGIPGIVRADANNANEIDAALLELYQRHAVEGKLTAPSPEHTRRFARPLLNAEYLKLIQQAVPSLSDEVLDLASNGNA